MHSICSALCFLTAFLTLVFFFPATSEQFILVSLDHLYNIYGQLKESRCGGGHKYLIVVE